MYVVSRGSYLKQADFEDCADNSAYYGELMEDGKIFSPSIHRRFLPSKYLAMVQGGFLLPASPVSFTWEIRRWLGLEISNLIRMKNTKNLRKDCKIRMYLLGKNIFNYLIKEERLSDLVFGRGLGRRDCYEWVYLVSEKWICENLDDLYNSYLAMGCYYTITSLQAFGKLSGRLEGLTKDGKIIPLKLSEGYSNDSDMKLLADLLRNDKVFRESLSFSCLSKLNLSESHQFFSNKPRLKNEEDAIEKFKAFYAKERHSKRAKKELYAKYNIPLVGGPVNWEVEDIPFLYVE